MLLSHEFIFCSVLLFITLPNIQTVIFTKKFNITLKAPGNTSAPTSIPHKSVHVRYNPSSDDIQQGTIVGFDPLIQLHQKAVQQLTIRLCNIPVISSSIWYDDDHICDDARSMIIYEWTPYSSSANFRTADDCGFEFHETQSIILTIIYQRERRLHKEQSGVVIHISTQSPKYYMGTMVVGNKQTGSHFSCRSANGPLLIYAVKNLNFHENKFFWRMHIIRVRYFGRKLVQPVFDAKTILNFNRSNIELTLSDLFFMKGDYLLIECENPNQTNCYFLIYYIYKSSLLPNNQICQNNSYASLFKLIPSKELSGTNETVTSSVTIDGSTIFLVVCLLLLLIWISIIIGCVIMRRIYGLVNFRTEPTSSFSTQKSKFLPGGVHAANDTYQRTGDVDHIMQMDADHGGIMS
ncbi:hypothetical protein I4U23_024515 [Adineta vaga]|nr:hypothetical protein I4U23_024515 [Adineta vaga]